MVVRSLDLLAGLACASFIYVVHRLRQKDALPLPPGPKGYPIIGNLLDMPRERAWEKLHQWCLELGSDIIHLNVLGQSVIILDSKEAVGELMERRSSIYSDRPNFPMVGDLMGLGFDTALLKYGDEWRSQRKLWHEVFHFKAAQNFRPHTMRAARKVLHRFLERPKDLYGNLLHMAGETIMSITYGLEVKADGDPYIKSAEDCVRLMAENSEPGSNMVDFLPFLKYIPEWTPGAAFHQRAKHSRAVAKDVLEEPFKAARNRIDQGNYIPSFISHCYSKVGEQAISAWQEYIIKGTAASMYIGGSDTTTNTVICCIYGLLENPDVLKRAQEEIDSVVPFGELPTFEDQDRLPFITAICKETMRWKVLSPIGVPHVLTQDDVYKGYRLPKGSFVIGNIWAMLNDEKVYPDGHLFKPGRFMKDGKLNPEVPDPNPAFGFGRRVCPGRNLALVAVWITVASLIAAFDFKKAVDANGKPLEIESKIEHYSGLLRSTRPFECDMKLRSPKYEAAIRAQFNED